jgi:hypothetical protein
VASTGVSKLLIQSLIDIEKWDKAGWHGVGYLIMQDKTAPPCLGLMFNRGEIGREIFEGLRERLGANDPFGELRVAIIEGDVPNLDPGYFVHISSNPEKSLERAKAHGIKGDKAIVVSRIHRMNPDPGSPHLENFKTAYRHHGWYLLIPITVTPGSTSIDPHFDLSIGKSEVLFRHVRDVTAYDRDAVIFAK